MFQLLANENRQPSNEQNGVIERRLSGTGGGPNSLEDGILQFQKDC